jgi:hypothetical protein
MSDKPKRKSVVLRGGVVTEITFDKFPTVSHWEKDADPPARPQCKEVVETVVIGVPTQYVYDESAPGLCRLPDPTPDATVDPPADPGASPPGDGGSWRDRPPLL